MQTSLSVHQSQAGFSLIELMITLTILAILLFMGQGLTRAWIDRAHVNQTINLAQTAISMSKAAALRNTHNQPQQYPAASLCYDATSSMLTVMRITVPTMQACQQAEVLRQFKLPQGVSLHSNQREVECIAFNASGLLVNARGQSTDCHFGHPIKILIEKHDERVELTLQ